MSEMSRLEQRGLSVSSKKLYNIWKKILGEFPLIANCIQYKDIIFFPFSFALCFKVKDGTRDYDKFSSGICVVGLVFDLPFLLPLETKCIFAHGKCSELWGSELLC